MLRASLQLGTHFLQVEDSALGLYLPQKCSQWEKLGGD